MGGVFLKKIKKCVDKLSRKLDDEEYDFKFNYHFSPYIGLINDPNGFSYYDGYYHIFFQWYPDGCKHGLKKWGHIKTKDFINYTSPKIALEADKPYDKDGCYSGSAIVDGDILKMFYTGNVKDENNIRSSYQCLAHLDKDGNIDKLGPLIDSVPDAYTAHFRDPQVFFYGDRYYMLIGAQRKDLKGRIVVYTSKDLNTWSFKGEIDTRLKDFGYMWECPNYVNVSDRDILIFSPQGLEKKEYKNQNIFQSGYIIGDLDLKKPSFNHGEFKELDKGFDFYAPQIMQEKDGRVILIAWMGVPGDEEKHPSIREGWIHGLTMPRKLSVKENILYQEPIEELKKLRDRELIMENIEFEDFSDKRVEGDSYELILEIDRYKSNGFEIMFALGEDEYTSFKYDFKDCLAVLDRDNMIEGLKGIRKARLDNQDSVKIHMFMDKSAVEIYIDGGKEVMTARIFPRQDSKALKIISKEGKAKIKRLQFWSLKGVNYCE